MDNLSRIGIFVEVARQESFAAAARELGITSSAVSKQVQNLEYDLKTKLLNRTTRKVSLTEEGALFFERSRRALEDLKEAADQMNELKATPRGTLKVSVPMALGVKYLKEPIAEFARLYPDVHLDIQFDDRLINIAEEGFDLVIRIGVLSDSSMIARKLARPRPMCAAVPIISKNMVFRKRRRSWRSITFWLTRATRARMNGAIRGRTAWRGWWALKAHLSAMRLT